MSAATRHVSLWYAVYRDVKYVITMVDALNVRISMPIMTKMCPNAFRAAKSKTVLNANTTQPPANNATKAMPSTHGPHNAFSHQSQTV